MVSSPVFLRYKGLLSKRKGLTLTELLIVVVIIALLAILVLVGLKPQTQLAKGRDARRKADLVKLKNLLEEYYNDKDCYPTGGLGVLVTEDYVDKLPTDPFGEPYYYNSTDCASYWIYAELEYEEDPIIAELGCEYGCGPIIEEEHICDYNYGVCSSDVGLEGCSGEAGQGPECTWGCQGNFCNDLLRDSWDCPLWFCTNDCDDKCTDPSYHCRLIE